MGEVASAVSTGDGLLFRGSDGVGESWQCLDVADSSAGSLSTLLLGREMFNIVQCGFIISGKTNSFILQWQENQEAEAT